MMKLFIAIPVNKAFRREAEGIQRQLKLTSGGGRFVPPENFHITLRYIGESRDLVGAAEAMAEAVRGIRPIELRLGGYSWLQKNERGRTSILKVEGDLRELNALYESLESALYDRGFPRENRRFTPHITLGRSVAQDELSAMELAAAETAACMQAREIVLYESVREKGGQVYRPMHRAGF